MNIKMNYQKHCLVTSKNQRETFSTSSKMGHRGRAVLQQFYQKTFRKKRYQTNSETKANQNEKLEIISYSQRIKKEKEPLISQQTPKT